MDNYLAIPEDLDLANLPPGTNIQWKNVPPERWPYRHALEEYVRSPAELTQPILEHRWRDLPGFEAIPAIYACKSFEVSRKAFQFVYGQSVVPLSYFLSQAAQEHAAANSLMRVAEMILKAKQDRADFDAWKQKNPARSHKQMKLMEDTAASIDKRLKSAEALQRLLSGQATQIIEVQDKTGKDIIADLRAAVENQLSQPPASSDRYLPPGTGRVIESP